MIYCVLLIAIVPGVFSDRVGRKTAAAASITSVHDQITIRQDETRKQSHTAGFEVSGACRL